MTDSYEQQIEKMIERDIILDASGFVYAPEGTRGFLTEDVLDRISAKLREKNNELFKGIQEKIESSQND